VNRFLGYSLHFSSGLHLGFSWVHGNGETSKTSAVIAAYHPPRSITWRWALDWTRPVKLLCLPRCGRWSSPHREQGSIWFALPIVGGLHLRWQPYMWRDK
jgi:hypothetical protein